MGKNQEIYTKTHCRESRHKGEGGHFCDSEIHVELIRKHEMNASHLPHFIILEIAA